jgi:hypothetical protein
MELNKLGHFNNRQLGRILWNTIVDYFPHSFLETKKKKTLSLRISNDLSKHELKFVVFSDVSSCVN